MKTGLDDYLVRSGREALHRLIGETDFLPMDRKVRQSELLRQWLPIFLEHLKRLDQRGGENLLRHTFRKGLVNCAEGETRKYILAQIERNTTADIRSIFRATVEEHLKEKFGSEWRSANGPEHQKDQRLSTADNKEVRVVDCDDGFVWVESVKYRDRSWPIPNSRLKAAPTGGRGSREDFAGLFLEHARNLSRDRLYFRGTWYEYENGGYGPVPDESCASEICGFIRKSTGRSAPPAKIKEALINLQAEGMCYVPHGLEPPLIRVDDKWEPAPQGIAFRNGYLVLRALEEGREDSEILLPASPNLFVINRLPVVFDPHAVCPRWTAFLKQMLPDEDIRNCTQEMFGYCLVPGTEYQVFFIALGPGANGKKVTTDALGALVGESNRCSVPLSNFGQQFSLWPLAISLVNIVAEFPTPDWRDRFAEDRLNAVVSGDPMTFERKNKDTYTACATAKQVFTCNDLPYFHDRSNGVWRRLILLPFKVTIGENEKDPNLAALIIREELPGICNFALDGLLRLRQRGGFRECDISAQLKQEHRQDCAPEEGFLRERVTEGTDADFVAVGDLYAEYRTVMAADGHHPMAKTRFGHAICRLFPKAEKNKRTIKVQGEVRGYSQIKRIKQAPLDGEET